MKITHLDRDMASQPGKPNRLPFITDPPFTKDLVEPTQELIRTHTYLKEVVVASENGRLVLSGFTVPYSSTGLWVMKQLEQLEGTIAAAKKQAEEFEQTRRKEQIDATVAIAQQLGFPTD